MRTIDWENRKIQIVDQTRLSSEELAEAITSLRVCEAPDDTRAYNPVFDVTPASLVSEAGVIRPGVDDLRVLAEPRQGTAGAALSSEAGP